jgi:hypothetical protein
MEGTARIWFTPQQKAELWERWKNGQCVADIARALERRNKSGVYLNGGIAPERRRRAAGALRLEEPEEISRAGAEKLQSLFDRFRAVSLRQQGDVAFESLRINSLTI